MKRGCCFMDTTTSISISSCWRLRNKTNWLYLCGSISESQDVFCYLIFFENSWIRSSRNL